MRKFITLVIFMGGFLSASYAIGQIYDDKSEMVTGPMDRLGEHAKNIQTNASFDKAIERHFIEGHPSVAVNEAMNAEGL